ncbi:cation transporter [Sphingobium sp. LB126]|uniref:CDF family Co(II)/Ni(II) efflux transporter DmeF n=1 Tax=Sphingobium sp. LB126 TaxID=1983755 RepID=UPI000C2029C2|nr:CDF family Co(II)/Ni(II) efflux transporter DmeF [Sphingobium sp. LB126]PJG48533.1 cation transporter [Sphingobium sp. LB126]
MSMHGDSYGHHHDAQDHHDHHHDLPPAFTNGDGEESHYFDHIYLTAGHDQNARRTIWVLWLTAATMVVEIVFGWLTGSMALLADGFHMATHTGAMAVAAAAYNYAKRHARNPRYTFGTGKVGDLSGFASALILAFTALFIAVESATRLFQPVSVAFGEAASVAVLGLVINLISALMLGHDHSHDHAHAHAHGKGHADNNLRAAYVHVLTDALTSVLAIIALLAGRYMGWWWMDPAVGLLGSAVIAQWAWGLMKDTSAILLDTAEPALMARIKALAEAEGAVLRDLHVWRVGPHAHAAILSLAPGADVAAVRQAVNALPRMEHVTVETV